MGRIRITHQRTGEVLAEGPAGLFGITSFEGNYYIRRRYLRTKGFRVNWIPGLCVYKFLYVGFDFVAQDGTREYGAGWLYWLPNPLLPFIAFRPAVPGSSPMLLIEDRADGQVDEGAGSYLPRRRGSILYAKCILLVARITRDTRNLPPSPRFFGHV